MIGIGCRFPGGEDGPEAFWETLRSGANLVRRGRPDGLMPEAPEPEAAPWGAYVEGLDRFDADFFRIAPVEAELLDPQQRLLLEVSWEALEDGGLDPRDLEGSRTGVYAGIMNSDYGRLLDSDPEEPGQALYLSTGTSFSTAIGRVAFTLGLQGPAVAVDTACSSSLVAIHQAAASLERGEVDLALAGGVNAIFTAWVTEAFEQAGILAADGRCKTFDASADGYVRGEGCGVLVLKRLADAERDADRILGVLRGSAVNQDGASAGLTVPNGSAQEAVIREALLRAGVAPAEVDYLEAHGTGTELGDPIEVRAAAAVYGEGRDPERPLLIGSVKTNVGHLEAAAGVVGVVKALLALRHRTVPRHLHFETPNPRIDWDSLPVRVASESLDWPEPAGRPPRAAVSSFGMSGTNAHLILEAWERRASAEARPSSDRQGAPGGGRLPRAGAPGSSNRLLPLSAQTPDALRQLAAHYLTWLERRDPSSEDLADAAWTASVGRRHFEHRAAVLFADPAELREGLAAVAESAAAALPPADPESPEAVAAATYEAGGTPAFRELFAGERRRRVALPTYPFQRRRHWIRPSSRRAPGADPLLGERRELPGGEVSFEIESAALGWLRDHRLFGQTVAPAAFYGAGALAALAAVEPGAPAVFIEALQLARPLILPEAAPPGEDRPEPAGPAGATRTGEAGGRPRPARSRSSAGGRASGPGSGTPAGWPEPARRSRWTICQRPGSSASRPRSSRTSRRPSTARRRGRGCPTARGSRDWIRSGSGVPKRWERSACRRGAGPLAARHPRRCWTPVCRWPRPRSPRTAETARTTGKTESRPGSRWVATRCGSGKSCRRGLCATPGGRRTRRAARRRVP